MSAGNENLLQIEVKFYRFTFYQTQWSISKCKMTRHKKAPLYKEASIF